MDLLEDRGGEKAKIMELWDHGRVWVGRELEDHFVPAPATVPNWISQYPTWPWALPGTIPSPNQGWGSRKTSSGVGWDHLHVIHPAQHRRRQLEGIQEKNKQTNNNNKRTSISRDKESKVCKEKLE